MSHSAASGVAGAVLKNTASTRVARLQLDANKHGHTGNCTLNALGKRSGSRTG